MLRCRNMETENTDCVSYNIESGNLHTKGARVEGLCENEPLCTSAMYRSKTFTKDADPHMYESLHESQIPTRLAEASDTQEEGTLDKQDVEKMAEVPLKEKLCIALLITTVTCLVVSNAILVLLLIDGKLQCTGEFPSAGFCPKNINIENAEVVNRSGYKHGDVVKIKCNNRSNLVGPDEFSCLYTGNWSAYPRCVLKNCGDFALPYNMKNDNKSQNTEVGTEIFLSCTEGFEMVGNNSTVCQSDETWSEIPTCRMIDCGLPGYIENAKPIDPVNTTYNSKFSVECMEGYILKGLTNVTCTKSGVWDKLPTCERVSCGLPDIPLNGSIKSINGTSFQSRVTLRCDEGFNLTGNGVIVCQSTGQWTGGATCINTRSDCIDLLKRHGVNDDGIYTIITWKSRQKLDVYCDMTTSGGGWTVFQNRYDGSVEFYRNFSEYEHGFGNLSSEFWLGLQYVQEISSQGESELRIDLESENGTEAYEMFSGFSLSEKPKYALIVGPTSDSLYISNVWGFGAYHNGSMFSTYDRDMDTFKGNCAEDHHGAWWYKDCQQSNLNGQYMTPATQDTKAMFYASFLNYQSLQASRMMTRRRTGA